MAPVWPHLGLQKPYLVFPPTHQLPCALYCSMCSVLLSDTLLYYPHFNRKINWGSEMLSNLHKITQVIRIWFQTWGVTELFCVLSRAQKEASCSSPRPTPLPPRLFPIFLFSPFLPSSSSFLLFPLFPFVLNRFPSVSLFAQTLDLWTDVWVPSDGHGLTYPRAFRRPELCMSVSQSAYSQPVWEPYLCDCALPPSMSPYMWCLGVMNMLLVVIVYILSISRRAGSPL